jgi:hypothetical protein
MTVIGIPLSIKAYQQCDLSNPILNQPYDLIVPWPKEESRLLAPIRPFQPMVIYIVVFC